MSVIISGLLFIMLISLLEHVGRVRLHPLSPDDKVKLHILQVKQEAKCSVPAVRVIRISRTKSNMKYENPCVTLHYCGVDMGCCEEENHSCVPSKAENVTVTFPFEWMNKTTRGKGVEERAFLNHTECTCSSESTFPMDDSLKEGILISTKFFEDSSSHSKKGIQNKSGAHKIR